MDTKMEVLEDEANELSLQDIYQQLVAANELILTIPEDEEEGLRKGLASFKNKQNTKLRESGLVPDRLVLRFNTYPHRTDEGSVIAGIVDVHIVLAPRAGIKVLKMSIPDNSI